MADERFIQKAIPESHKGRLREFAQSHHTLNKDKTINLDKTQQAADKIRNKDERLKRTREVNLAKNLAKLRNR